jgi:hypothetical protein
MRATVRVQGTLFERLRETATGTHLRRENATPAHLCRPMGPLTARDSAAAITVVLALYAHHLRTVPSPAQLAGCNGGLHVRSGCNASDDWARGIVVGHASVSADPTRSVRATPSAWIPRLNMHVSRDAAWASDELSVGRFRGAMLLLPEAAAGGATATRDLSYRLEVEFDDPTNEFSRVRAVQHASVVYSRATIARARSLPDLLVTRLQQEGVEYRGVRTASTQETPSAARSRCGAPASSGGATNAGSPRPVLRGE